jgi:hypothetical protein
MDENEIKFKVLEGILNRQEQLIQHLSVRVDILTDKQKTLESYQIQEILTRIETLANNQKKIEGDLEYLNDRLRNKD